jgi:hypothetical protein
VGFLVRDRTCLNHIHKMYRTHTTVFLSTNFLVVFFHHIISIQLYKFSVTNNVMKERKKTKDVRGESKAVPVLN